MNIAECLAAGIRVGAGRIALVVEYDGTRYRGWQIQATGVTSVQGELTRAVSFVANEAIELTCAGRTDAGVHATYQIVHFDTAAIRDSRSWVLGINTQLPPDIVVRWVGQMAPDFHARFTATARRYRYVILNTPVRPAVHHQGVTWVFQPLNARAMHESAQCLLGEQDFSSYRAAGCQSNTPFRRVDHVRVSRHGDYVVIDIQANAFLHHMVRNIAGVLIEVGAGRQPMTWPAAVLAGRDRTLGGVTAPPGGLYLVDVHYPDGVGLPRPPIGPSFVGALLDS